MASQLNCFLIYTLYVSCGDVAAAPVQSSLPGIDYDGGDATKTEALKTTDDDKYINDGTTPDADNFIHYGNAALFYVGGGFFTVIMINPYEDLLTKLTSDTTVHKIADEVEFNLTIMRSYSFSQESSGLVRAVKTDSGDVTVNLDGLYPEDAQCQFKVLEYLETKNGVPVANYLLLESSLYPGHYLRWYDGVDGKVDCQPEEKNPGIPGNDNHFYWKFALPSTTPVAAQMLPVQLQTYDQQVLEFVNKTPKVTKDSVHSIFISQIIKTYFELMIIVLQVFTAA